LIVFEQVTYKNFLSAGNKPITIQLNKVPITVVVGQNGSGKCLDPHTRINVRGITDEAHEALQRFVEDDFGDCFYVSIGELYEFIKENPNYSASFEVEGRHGFKQILDCFVSSIDDDCVEVSLEDGNSVISSFDHIWMMKDKGWISAKCLRVGDCLETKSGYSKIVSLDVLPEKRDLFDLTVAEQPEFYANGIVSHNSSGVIDSIFFALYGKSFRKLKKEQLVNSINRKNCVVELVFSIGSTKYKIVRGIKPNVFEIYVNNKLHKQPASLKDYQDWLENTVLKMNETTMKQIVFLGSSTYVSFMRLSAKERRNVVEEILDIQVFSLMNEVVKEKLSKLKETYHDTQKKIDIINSEIRLLESHKEKMNAERVDRIEDYRAKIDKALAVLADLNEAAKKDTEQIDSLSASIVKKEQTEKEANELKFLKKRIDANVKKLKSSLSFFETTDVCPTCEQAICDEVKSNKVDELKNKLSNVVLGSEQAERALEEFESKLAEMNAIHEKICSIEKRIIETNSRIASGKQYIETLEKEMNDLVNKDKDDSSLTEIDDEISSKRAEKIEAENELSEIADMSQYHKTLMVMLKDDGIKKQIINNYLPTINSLIRKYLEILEFPCEFTFDDEFNETMKSRYRDVFSYENFSEGQKLRIDLATLFTWRELAKLRNSASCNLLVLDEIGSSSLDAEGTEAFLKIISAVSAENNNVFIISHDSYVNETDSTSRFLKYTIKNNFSVVEEVA